MKKKNFVEDKERLYLDDIFEDKTLDEVINKFLQVREGLKEKQDCKFKIDYCYGEIQDGIYLTYKRVETDKEYEKRLEKEQKVKEKQKKKEDSERRQYERLKKKFEGK